MNNRMDSYTSQKYLNDAFNFLISRSYHKATESYDTAIQLNPDYIEAYIGRAHSRFLELSNSVENEQRLEIRDVIADLQAALALLTQNQSE